MSRLVSNVASKTSSFLLKQICYILINSIEKSKNTRLKQSKNKKAIKREN